LNIWPDVIGVVPQRALHEAAAVLVVASRETVHASDTVRKMGEILKFSRPFVSVALDSEGADLVTRFGLAPVIDGSEGVSALVSRLIHKFTALGLPCRLPGNPNQARPKKPVIFLSYASAEFPIVERLRAELIRLDLEPWAYEVSQRLFNVTIDTELDRKITECTAFLAVVTHAYVQSTWCMNEYRKAMRVKSDRVVRIAGEVGDPPELLGIPDYYLIPYLRDESRGLRELQDALHQFGLLSPL
jgi:hypothetical protein